MNEERSERILAECLQDYHRRRARGEAPVADDYRSRAGDAFEDLVGLLLAEEEIDRIIDPVPESGGDFPRPFGEYTVLEEIGRGAMGVVYEAVHRALGRRVALKVLRTGMDTEPLALERFRREARACAQVRHDNIVEIYDAGEVDGRPYYSMAFLEGRPLNAVIGPDGMEDLKAVALGFSGVASALCALHAEDIVHRDVKPSNVLLEDDGQMVLADFGLARSAAAERLTTTGQALGTPLYMSPEQILGKGDEVDGRADVYALGATMYEAVTGRPIFAAADTAAILRMILSEQPDPPRHDRPDLPKAFERIILKSLEKRREDRYESAAKLHADLVAFATGREVEGRPVSPSRRMARRARPFLPAAGALVVLAVIGALFWARRDASLTVRCNVPAMVAVDGVAVGQTPLEGFELRPGDHRIRLAREGFFEHEETITLDAGETRVHDKELIAADSTSRKVLEALARRLGIELPEPDETGGADRSGDPIVVMFPRGEIDAATAFESIRVDVTDRFDGAGALQIRRGDEVLHVIPFDPDDYVARVRIPDEVRARIGPGDRITWGWYPLDGDPVTAAATISRRDLGPRLAEIDAALKDQPEPLRRLIRAAFLLEEGRAQAACEEATTVLEADPDHRAAWETLLAGLHRIGLSDSGPATRARESLRRVREGE